MGCFPYLKGKLKGRGQSRALDLSGKKSSGNFIVQDQTIIKSSNSSASPRGIPDLYQEKAHNLRVFSFSELRQATRDFAFRFKIGEGGFGSVYKGYIKPLDGDGDHVAVAIKTLNKDSLQGHKQWVAEVQFLGVVEHPNLVKLIGYCAVDGDNGNIQRLLVYQLMRNRSLEDHLFRRVYPPLLWKTRLQIMLGAAQGLSYLHEGLEVQVIFRDFKCSNVLLDENFEPRLSDFGLAREGPVAGNTHVSTAVVGTHGYAAPDYIETGRLTVKSDVWSFGVVLYEILTGRRSFERGLPKPEQILLNWKKQFPPDSKRFVMMLDPRLGNQFSVKAAREIAKLADTCLLHNAKERPNMSEVVERLNQIIDAPDEGNLEEYSFDSSCSDNDEAEKNIKDDGVERNTKDDEASESWKRRMSQLAKLGQYVEGEDRSKLRVTRRLNVSKV